MAAALLRSRLPHDAEGVEIATAGVLPGARPVDPVAVEILAERGLETGATESRHLTVDEVRRADLILCMERRHLRDVVVVDREAFGRAFTLRELVRRGETIGPRAAGTSLEAYIERLGAGREAADLTHDAPDDDIADPTGGPLTGYEHTARWLDGLLHRAVGLLLPPGAATPRPGPRPEPQAAPVEPETLVGTEAPAAAPAARAEPSGSQDVEVQRWRRRSGPGPDGVVGIVAHDAAFRLARSVTHSLRAHGFDQEITGSDAWLARTWAHAADEATAALAAGEIDAAIVLSASAMAPAALANRHPAVRAATPTDVSMARRARQSLGANLLCLGTEEVTASEAQDIVAVFLAVAPLVPEELARPLAPEPHAQ